MGRKKGRRERGGEGQRERDEEGGQDWRNGALGMMPGHRPGPFSISGCVQGMTQDQALFVPKRN